MPASRSARPIPTRFSSGGWARSQWFFLGGEVVVDFAIRIKAEQRGPKTWVAGYTNDVMAYIPSAASSPRAATKAAAMVYYGQPDWSEQVENQIMAEVTRQAAGRSGKLLRRRHRPRNHQHIQPRRLSPQSFQRLA